MISASPITLHELTRSIRYELNASFPEYIWVIAEIGELKMNRNGHCYLELVEKNISDEKLLTRIRATIWNNVFRQLKPYFEQTTGQELRSGLKVLLLVTVEFHELYGLSLNVTNIDPAYTLGDLERKRQETIAKLKSEGYFGLNRMKTLPPVAQKIAVISSETAAGYLDFMKQIQGNPYDYKLYIKLYPSAMQGVEAESSIIHALELIEKYSHFFDAVVIIRGGGSKSDLACFDYYQMALHVARSSLPVLTGIGHEQDESIVDMVAHTRLKTPTAVAEFLIDRMAGFETRLYEMQQEITTGVTDILNKNKTALNLLGMRGTTLIKERIYAGEKKLIDLKHRLNSMSRDFLQYHKKKIIQFGENLRILHKSMMIFNVHVLKSLAASMYKGKNAFLQHKQSDLKHKSEILHSVDPRNILNKGFSLTLLNGKVVKDSSEITKGDKIDTVLSRGSVSSIVESTKKQ